MEGEIVLKEFNYELNLNFSQDNADLNLNVFINVRKQTRQKVEGISASQL